MGAMFEQWQIRPVTDIPYAQAIEVVASGAITGGDIVVPNGTSAGLLQMVQADADSAALARGRLFVALGGAASGAKLHVVPWALLVGGRTSPINTAGGIGLDTSAAAVGDPVYLSATAGGITLTRPADPREQIVVGVVSVVSATVGQVLLSPGEAASGFTAASDILLADNQAAALDVRQGASPYLRFRTSDLTEAVFIEPNGAAGDVAVTDHSGLRIGAESATTYVSAGDLAGHNIFIRTMTGGTSVAQANAGGRLDILVGAGGASATAAIAAGAGGRFDLRSGAGGASTQSGAGGAGGAMNIVTGDGGAHSVAGAGGGGGIGGALTIQSGAGGANSFAAGTAASGGGGDIAITSGVGGATSGAAATGAGGRGGDTTFICGDGGVQSVGAGAGGRGGRFTYTAGAGGANTFAGASQVGGAGGSFTLNGGVGGATASTGAHDAGAGGGYTALFGNGGAQSGAASAGAGGAGGVFSVTCGAGGNQSGGTGLSGAGGAVSIIAGAAGTQSGGAGAGGIGGDFTMTAGAGGANSFAGASAAGGRGGLFTITAGAGGNTASTGAHNGGAGGGLTALLGVGGNHTGAGAAGDGGAGGVYSFTAGGGGTTNATGAGTLGGLGGGFTFLAGAGGNNTGGGGNGGAGGSVAVTAGNAGTGGNAAGGNITLTPGTSTGTGVRGQPRIVQGGNTLVVGGSLTRTVAQSAVVNTPETVFAGGSSSIAANSLIVGSVIRFAALIDVNAVSGAGATSRVQVKLNGTAGTLVFDTTAVAIGGGAGNGLNFLIKIEGWLAVRTAGAGGTVTGVMDHHTGAVDAALSAAGSLNSHDIAGSVAGTMTAALNTTVINTLDITGLTDAAGTTLRLQMYHVWIDAV